MFVIKTPMAPIAMLKLYVLLALPAASAFFVAPARTLLNRARASLDESMYFAIAPSPFALTSNFASSAFTPAEVLEETVTLYWDTEQQQSVQSLITSGASHLGEIAGLTIVSASLTSDSGFKLVAKGTQVALRHFMQRAAVRNLAARRVEWGDFA